MSSLAKPSDMRLRRATHWARSAGNMAMELFKDVDAEWKKDDSYVTRADRNIEEFLREKIKHCYPTDRIMGEEEETKQGQEDSWSWYLDPIDGTGSYATKLPIWCVSVGIWKNEEPVHGVIYIPYMNELYYGSSKGDGYRNNSVITEPKSVDWNPESMLCVSSHAHLDYEIDFPGKTRSMGSTAYHMAMVADGRAVGAVLGHPHIWDMAGVMPVGKSVNIRMRKIGSGEPPDWSRLIRGEEPKKPLIYGHMKQLRELIPGVEYRGA